MTSAEYAVETPAEPMPGSAEAPFISETAQRMYALLPRAYRLMDAQQDYALKRYLAACAHVPGQLDELVNRFRGSRPVGPALPEPWGLDPGDLAQWRAARANINSALTDPDLAEPNWLPWLAQLVGAYLDPRASLAERRDTIRFATSGFRGGTRAALADAARSALTGSRYVLVQPFTRGEQGVGTMWDVTLRTRNSETPDPDAVLATVVRKGAKPAGVKLHHAMFGTSWDKVEALFPAWTEWDSRTWDQLEESGATYAVPDNLAPNPSFETGSPPSNWSAATEGGGTSSWTLAPGAGIDGANAGRLSKTNASGGMRLQSSVIIDARVLSTRDYVFAASVRPSAAVPMSLVIDWLNSSGAAISSTTVAVGTLTNGVWNRVNVTTQHTSPAGAARARLNLVATGTIPNGTILDVDAVLFRLITTTGG